MKITSFAIMALGLAVIVFSVICFISAGDIIDAAEMYSAISFITPDADHVELLEYAMVEVDGFSRFAYYARVWLLIGGIVLIAAGVAMFLFSRSASDRRAPRHRRAARPAPRGASGAPSMTCPSCGAAVAISSAFCMNCGSPMNAKPVSIKPVSVEPEPEYAYCPECGEPNDAGSRFCMNCGTALKTEAPSAAAVSGGAARVGSSTGTISATVVTGEAGTIRLDTSGYSTGTVRIAATAPKAEAPRPAAPEARPAEGAYAVSDAADDAATTGTVMLSMKEKPAAKPAPAKSRLMKAGDL